MFLGSANVSISGIGITIQDVIQIVVHLSWKCLGLRLEGCCLGLVLRWHCLVNITNLNTTQHC